MNGGRPDFERIRANASVIFNGAGETATLRSYVSASGGAPLYGVQPTDRFVESVITGLFASPYATRRGRERAEPAGQVQDADLFVSHPSALKARDEVVLHGVVYVVAGDAQPQTLGDRVQYQSPLKRAGATG